ncbi:hypothetical protein CALVIDRAFT_554183 [Calocera viscosa TUFC12733]|uniref:Btz domain-containing protein n=1 Tax=Calocera viscosa (strain TUFC12733) TaxID=1330018 RepID=A0A167NVU7_CALVF|nr:hypothetical protein CALVIDRAFT_554183 [Calocera viscosa TUFC12733]
MIMAASSTSPAHILPKLAQQTASVPDLQHTQPAASSSAAQPTRNARKTKHARRRRRGEEEDSEDEIVREDVSGSESDRELVVSETESDVEDVDEVPALAVNGVKGATGSAPTAAPDSIIPEATNWSDMVSSELDGGADASLPVIDFAEMGSTTERAPRAPVAAPVTNGVETAEVAAASTNTDKAPSRPGQSARQAYLDRITNDPQFIPRVGAFWGHDDRLLDKGLRSMSPWWRDRQMAYRGRGGTGRGGYEGGFRGRGRGRGGASSYGGRGEAEGEATPAQATNAERETDAGPSVQETISVAVPAAPPPPFVHPADLPWGHDGFEEMRKTDVERGGRGRGRGGLRGRGAMRGGPPAHDGSPVNGMSRPAPVKAPNAGPPGKKTRPEKPWTKDFAAHLYSDPTLQPKDNQGAGIRLKFPGSPDEGVVVRLPAAASKVERTASPASVASSKKGPKVKLPSAAKAQTPSGAASVVDGGDFAQTIGGTPLASPSSGDLVMETTTVTVAVPTHSTEPVNAVEVSVVDPVAKLEKQFQQLATQQQQTITPQPTVQTTPLVNGVHAAVVLHGKVMDALPESVRSEVAPPPHIQIPHQPYPQYGYSMALPPGIAMDENGVCFEVATGRVVILQQPAPSPMYHPRPGAAISAGFVPPHLRAMQNHSPDNFAPSPFSDGMQPTPPEGYPYPDQSGGAYFAQRRSSGAVSIRSPTEPSSGGKSTSHAPSSLLRAAVHAAPFQPNRAMVSPQNAPYMPRPGYFTTGYDVSPVRVNGPSSLPDDPAIVGQDPALAQYTQYYPAEQMYGYPQGEYAYTPYGYEGGVPDGYVQPSDGRGPAVYY